MSTYASAYKSLLQGVSQQVPSERLPGQLTAQLNMMSDPVTNLRRRPGVAFKSSFGWEDADDQHILGWFTDVAGTRCHILLNTNTGNVRMLDESFTEIANLNGGSYLTNTDVSRIRATAVGNEFFLCNCDQKPIVRTAGGGTDPSNSGFFYIVAGAFSKEYNIALVHSEGTVSATYTTPSGASAGDSAFATPEYIATQLYNQLSGLSFTDVRLTGWDSLGDPDLILLYNTGGGTYVDVTFPYEIPVSGITGGRLITRDATWVGGNFRISFQVKVGGTWRPETYLTEFLKHPYRTLNYTIPATAFTSKAELTGDPSWFVQRDGPYVFVSRSGSGVSVSTTTGKAYLVASKNASVSSAGELPSRLPAGADGFVCRVGLEGTSQYFKYVHAATEWRETGAHGSPSGLGNMPVSIYWNGTAWQLDSTDYEGRFAGDDDTNPTHEFASYGITGMATYQGRLVLMSGPMVSLSASNKPRRFFRSTLTNILNSDPIEIGSGMNSSAAYEHAVSFQKDLVLLSKAYQAVLPSGNAAITPATATVVPTSTHEVDTLSPPITIGRTLLYATPRSADFFGVMEMVPSPYTDSQYVSQDSTPHLPKYMAGRCRFAVSSGVGNMALFAPTGDVRSLLIHEYHWDGDQKVQQSWHTWTFPYPVATAYFAADKIVLVFVQNEQLVLGQLDPRVGVLSFELGRRPFLDLHVQASIVDRVVTPPAWLLTFDQTVLADVSLVVLSGGLAGEEVGFEVDGSVLRTVRSHSSGDVGLGIPYRSSFSPTQPIVRDYNGEVIHTDKATLLRFMLSTKNSSAFNVIVRDATSNDADDNTVGTLNWSSDELELGRALYSDDSTSIIPCRTDMRSTVMDVFTEGTGELNVVSLEYVGKFHPRIKRK